MIVRAICIKSDIHIYIPQAFITPPLLAFTPSFSKSLPRGTWTSGGFNSPLGPFLSLNVTTSRLMGIE